MNTNNQAGAGAPEDVLFPGLTIIDPHVHMWDKSGFDYFAPQLLADVHDGHKVEKTIYVECHMGYNNDPREAFQPVGETEYVLEQVKNAPKTDHALAAGILGCANLLAGSAVAPVLEAHIAAAKGRFRGIRSHVGYSAEPAVAYPNTPRYPQRNVVPEPEYLEGARCLSALGLTLDIWAMHPQLPSIAEFAAKIPELPIMIDHCGGPVGIGSYGEKPEQTFAEWTAGLRLAAQVPNVHIKLSGLGMARLGWKGEPAATSDELVAKWQARARACVEIFGPQRTVFASNFPVDKVAGSYRVVVNAYKKILADLPQADLQAIFCENARRFYRL